MLLDFEQLWEKLISVVVEASKVLLRLRDLELIETRSKGAGTFYVYGKRMREAEDITSPLRLSNPTDKTLTVG
ncbi:MAG: hypothetical protein M3R14_05740 [Acidobacteriota bacterium]|nr:hypothetical protein [Acidobacteriota bacterium]